MSKVRWERFTSFLECGRNTKSNNFDVLPLFPSFKVNPPRRQWSWNNFWRLWWFWFMTMTMKWWPFNYKLWPDTYQNCRQCLRIAFEAKFCVILVPEVQIRDLACLTLSTKYLLINLSTIFLLYLVWSWCQEYKSGR